MKAMIIKAFGGQEVSAKQQVPMPIPGPTNVLVRVYATSVNPVDYKVRQSANWAAINLLRQSDIISPGWSRNRIAFSAIVKN